MIRTVWVELLRGWFNTFISKKFILGLGLGLASHAVDQSLVKCQKFLAHAVKERARGPLHFLHLHTDFFF